MPASRGAYLCSTECPECESVRTRVINTGLDEDGRTIRSRECFECGKIFGTVEVVMPDGFSFGRTNTRRQTRKTRVASFSNDRISIGKIDIIKGKRSNYCVKGLHHIWGANLRRDRDGQRHCRACDNATRALYRMRHRAEQNQRQRERYHRQKRERELNGNRRIIGEEPYATGLLAATG